MKYQLKKWCQIYLTIGLLGCIQATTAFASQNAVVTLRANNNAHEESRAISANPASVNIFVGTGLAQSYVEKKLGIQDDHGVRIGGMLLGDMNYLFSGGVPDAERWTNNGLFLADLSINTEKAFGLTGGLFDVQFLQFNGQATNAQAGSVQGYNSLPGAPPLNRSELYQLWYRQELFSKKLIIRVGKTVPTFDFGNVIRPIPLASTDPDISAVTSLLYTPIFVNPSMLGVMPGYYNSAYGVTVSVSPIKTWYLTYGIYDGNLAQGKQTGLTGPTFNGAYFNIAETGIDWLLGKNKLPGTIGIGAWYQSGRVENGPTLSEQGASGYYIFGSQRLWYKNPSYDSSGISGFYQYGENNSNVLPMTKYVGAGLTAFGLMPQRLNDSMGAGVAYSWLDQTSFSRQHELMYQAYYQAQVLKNIFYLEPAISYIPAPGASAGLEAAWAGTLRAILLF